MTEIVYGEAFARRTKNGFRLESQLLSWCCSGKLTRHVDRKYARDLPRLRDTVPVEYFSCGNCDTRLTEDGAAQTTSFVLFPARAERLALTFSQELPLTVVSRWYEAFCGLDPLSATLQGRLLLEAFDGLLPELNKTDLGYGTYLLRSDFVSLD